jgi:adenylate cyclase
MISNDRSEIGQGHTATVAFIDLAGFSATTEVYGDETAVAMIELFETIVRDALVGHPAPLKWIGDEVMLAFDNPEAALGAVGRLIEGCRADPRLPLTRAGISHGPVIRRGHDVYGSTVNKASRLASRALPGQMLATRPVADAARDLGILVHELGHVAVRSIIEEVALYEIVLAGSTDPRWIDPVCKMHAPFAIYQHAVPQGIWFCSSLCEEAYRRSPDTYPLVS